MNDECLGMITKDEIREGTYNIDVFETNPYSIMRNRHLNGLCMDSYDYIHDSLKDKFMREMMPVPIQDGCVQMTAVTRFYVDNSILFAQYMTKDYEDDVTYKFMILSDIIHQRKHKEFKERIKLFISPLEDALLKSHGHIILQESVDLSKVKNYDDLLNKLIKIFY